MARKNKTIEMVSEGLLVAGGLNWGLDRVNLNLVDYIGAVTHPIVSTLVYVGVFAAAVYKVLVWTKVLK